MDKTEKGIRSPVSLGRSDESVKCCTKQCLKCLTIQYVYFTFFKKPSQTAYTSKIPYFNRESHKNGANGKIHFLFILSRRYLNGIDFMEKPQMK